MDANDAKHESAELFRMFREHGTESLDYAALKLRLIFQRGLLDGASLFARHYPGEPR